MSKEKGVMLALEAIKKRFGDESIFMLDEKEHKAVEVIPTGCLSLDRALGVGGLPRGRIVEIYGPESSGKSTLALHTVAEAQKMGGLAVYIDTEHALDPVYAEKLGVRADRLLISQPESGEKALEIAEAAVRSGEVAVVVVDSVAALITQAEINGEMGDAVMGSQARLMSQAMRKLTPVVGSTNTLMIFINQLRSKIGIVYGNPETTPGGNALKFYASIRIDIRRQAQLKDSSGVFGNRTKVKIVKNKVAPPFREVEFDIIYGEGVSKTGDLMDVALELGILEQKGAWFSYNDERFQGKENLRQRLLGDPDLFEGLREAVYARLSSTE